MVRITANLYEEAYDYIRQDSAHGNCVMLVAADVDSLCAALMLQNLLKKDMIAHKLVPVSGYRDLERAKEQIIEKDEDLVSIIMINCGGLIDVREFFDIESYTKIYVFDSHRPLKLENIHHNNINVCVFDDDRETEKLEKVLEAFESLTYNSEDNSENMDSDSSDELLENTRSKRRRLDEDQDLSRSARIKKRAQSNLLMNYYTQGAYHANSTAGIVYDLATKLSKTDNDMLWLAIIGVTSQYLHEKIDTTEYIRSARVFRDDTARFNINTDEEMAVINNEGEIRIEDEYRFMFFRHWSLYESMYYSSYVVSKLGLWNPEGDKNLNRLLAQMGFRLEQCKQIYTHMDVDLKDRLRTKIEEISPRFGLTELCYPSFTRGYDRKCVLSAADVAYAISALLETSPTTAVHFGAEGTWTENRDWRDMLANDVADDATNEKRRWWVKNFYKAYDALGKQSSEMVLHGIRVCMETQQAIARQVFAAISKRLIKKHNNCWIMVVDGGPDLPVFGHQLTLFRMGLFALDILRTTSARLKPLIVTSLDEVHNVYIFTSMVAAPAFGETRRNKFPLAFQKLEEKGLFVIDSFDLSSFELKRDTFVNAIKEIKYE